MKISAATALAVKMTISASVSTADVRSFRHSLMKEMTSQISTPPTRTSTRGRPTDQPPSAFGQNMAT